MTKQTRQRLDVSLLKSGLVSSRSQAESYIKLGSISVNGKIINKPGQLIAPDDELKISQQTQYVSRAALKLESITQEFKLNFKDKNVLDVGSSTGGFTDFALKNGAKHVVGVEIGTEQMHPSIRSNPKVELYEKTDILDVYPGVSKHSGIRLAIVPDIIVIDLSFISLRKVLPHIATLASSDTLIIAMVKPQFEADNLGLKHKGVIKNETIRRQILRDFELWSKQRFIIKMKADSKVSGSKGNLERFYLLKKI